MWSVTTIHVYRYKFLINNILCANPGDYEKGVDHLTNAIAVCGQPQQLLQVLQQTLPPPVFQMLLTKLPSISQVRSPYHTPYSFLLISVVLNIKFPVLSSLATLNPPVAKLGLWDKKGCKIKLRVF